MGRVLASACLVLFAGCQLIVGFDEPGFLSIESLSITPGALEPAFSLSQGSYFVMMPHGDTVTVRARASDPDSTIEVSNDTTGDTPSILSSDSPHTVRLVSGLNRITVKAQTPQGVTTSVFIDANVPGARFAAPVKLSEFTNPPKSIKVADFNGDFFDDAAVCNSAGVTVIDVVNDSRISLAGMSSCLDFAISNLDNLKGPDIVAVNGGTTALVFLNTGTGTFDPPGTAGSGQGFISVALGSINNNNDASVDALLGDSGSGPTDGRELWVLGDGAGGFGATQGPLFGAAGVPATVVLGSFDTVAGTDAMVLDGGNSAITLLRGDGVGGFTKDEATTTSPETAPMVVQSLVLVNADADPAPDWAAIHADTNELAVVRDFAGSETANPVTTTLPTELAPTQVVAADVDRDGHEDLIVTCRANKLEVFYGDGTGKFRPVRFDIVAPVAVAVADFSRDQIPDILVATETGDLHLFRQVFE